MAISPNAMLAGGMDPMAIYAMLLQMGAQQPKAGSAGAAPKPPIPSASDMLAQMRGMPPQGSYVQAQPGMISQAQSPDQSDMMKTLMSAMNGKAAPYTGSAFGGTYGWTPRGGYTYTDAANNISSLASALSDMTGSGGSWGY